MALPTLPNMDVSRETLEKLDHYCELIKKWNPKINLVSPRSIPEIWSRHFVDSAQIIQYADQSVTNWCDFGSGGGFPGIVVAILSGDIAPDRLVTLVESDKRKAAFLATVTHSLALNARVISDRIEQIEPLDASVISARALTGLSDLLSLSQRHLSKTGICLFSKGEHWRDEVSEAQKNWTFSFEPMQSVTDPKSVILKVENIERV